MMTCKCSLVIIILYSVFIFNFYKLVKSQYIFVYYLVELLFTIRASVRRFGCPFLNTFKAKFVAATIYSCEFGKLNFFDANCTALILFLFTHIRERFFVRFNSQVHLSCICYLTSRRFF